ncbi:MAG: M15 family metallopeptidase [Elusimicrobiota bacterium]
MIALIEARRLVPGALLDVRYAGTRNGFGRAFYPFPALYLLRSTAEKLAAAQRALEARGLGLELWDGYRPLSVQRLMWALKPDPLYVADPSRGSQHNRGAAVDLTLVAAGGKKVAMPSDFDDFSAAAAHSGPHAALLRSVMEAAGFRALAEEWWHYSDPAAADEPLLDIPFEALGS